MLKVEDRERIRRAYHVEGKSMRQIEREYHHSRHTIKKALASAESESYRLNRPRPAPVLGPYKARIDELLRENENLPPKQRYTGHKIYKEVQQAGYKGSQSGVTGYITRQRKAKRKPKVFIPLEFDPGIDGQVDWGEAWVILAGEKRKVQLFVMRLCYSRRPFVMAFPNQKQEAFFAGHVAAFHHFQGVPHRLAYDNLKAAVLRILTGRNRQEQEKFIEFRSHHLFDSRFCTPGQGHEKGGVEHGVGYARRNFMVPLPKADSFEALNEQLRQACLEDDQRRVDRQPLTIYEAWQEELKHLRPLPDHDYDCCTKRIVKLNGYGQVEIDTNRYSVPADLAEAELTVKLYPFQIKVYGSQQREPIAVHNRCYERKQDIFDPLHYLPLLTQRPGALEHAKPIRQWRAAWPAVYDRLQQHLQRQWPDGRGVRQFIRILQLHREHPAELIEQAVSQALRYNCAHADGVELCLRQLLQPEPECPPLDLNDHPKLAGFGQQELDLTRYNQLLVTGGTPCQ
jgi:transposase